MAAATTPKRNTSNEYHGPGPKEMIANHSLAQNIIERHNDPCPIFDDRSILLLREFVNDPSRAGSILERLGLADEGAEQSGTKATNAGDLAAYIVAKHGTDEPTLTGEEIGNLKQWFHNGGGKTDAELAALA